MKGFDLKSYAAEPQFVKEIGHAVKKVRHETCHKIHCIPQAAGQEFHCELMILSAQCRWSGPKPILRAVCISGSQTLPVGGMQSQTLTCEFQQLPAPLCRQFSLSWRLG